MHSRGGYKAWRRPGTKRGRFPAETAASLEAQNEQRAWYEGRSVGLKASATEDGTRYVGGESAGRLTEMLEGGGGWPVV